ncbi:unnamed protein product [Diabrotica balteata]|uniref:Uncharacterized protein n=1 Tax=Diabrotica balteata TaxID=107213 RepID=A0A9N9SL33_DIABA|nr:unnamed protein product [Diabrotica balteata]
MSIFGIILLSLAICLIIFLLVIFKFGHVKCESNVCLIGKVALVTGGSSGLLKKSSDGRIVFTSSVASFLHTTTIDSITENEIKLSKYRMNDYTCGKLCTVIASDIFAEKLKKYNITCNTYHPGVARSNFFNNCYVNLNQFSLTDWWSYASIVFLRIFVGVSPRQASQPAIMLAISEEFKNVTGTFHGKYFPDLKPLGAHNKVFCKKIWDVSEKIVKLSSEEKI